jgi:hypothetical protein
LKLPQMIAMRVAGRIQRAEMAAELRDPPVHHLTQQPHHDEWRRRIGDRANVA